MESKILDLIRETKSAALAVEDAQQSDEFLRLVSEARDEFLEQIKSSILDKGAIIKSQESIILMIEQFIPSRRDIVMECENSITLANRSIYLYKELEDEINGI